MQRHHFSDLPWSRVTADQFKLYGKEFLTPVDFYSGFMFHRSEKVARHQIQLCDCIFKEQFSRCGIPDTLVTDNGPQFTSHEFHQFSRDWAFLHVSSFPHHHKANGKVESAVKVAKSLIKKAFKDNKDPWVALLGQRNTLTESLGTRPTQRLMSRSTRTLQFTVPKASRKFYGKLNLKKQKAKWYHDRSFPNLPEIEIG